MYCSKVIAGVIDIETGSCEGLSMKGYVSDLDSRYSEVTAEFDKESKRIREAINMISQNHSDFESTQASKSDKATNQMSTKHILQIYSIISALLALFYFEVTHYHFVFELPPANSPYNGIIESWAPFLWMHSILCPIAWIFYFCNERLEDQLLRNPAELTIKDDIISLKWINESKSSEQLKCDFITVLHHSSDEIEALFQSLLMTVARKNHSQFRPSPIVVVRGVSAFSNLEKKITRLCLLNAGARLVIFAQNQTTTSEALTKYFASRK